MTDFHISNIIYEKSLREPSSEEKAVLDLLIDTLYPVLREEFLRQMPFKTRLNYVVLHNESFIRRNVWYASLPQKKMAELGFLFPINWINHQKKNRKKYMPCKLDEFERSWHNYYYNLSKESE